MVIIVNLNDIFLNRTLHPCNSACFVSVRLTVGALCKEPKCTGLSGPAGGAVLQVRAGERTTGPLPPADWTDEGSGLHHSAR